MKTSWEKEVKATAWKHSITGNTATYILQVDHITGKQKENRIRKEFKEWATLGEGYNPKSKEATLIFKKEFDTENAWKKWARAVSFSLIEIGPRSGKPKNYKLGIDYQPRKGA
mgnify:CR=1 FL=1|tara:strand:- start:326 stop:664 length:339 start_codon:yes stop_codon:yes gene_type:complete